MRQSLNDRLLRRLQGGSSRVAHNVRLRKALLANDFAGLESLFKALFAGIPYQWHTKNDIADYEGYYASVFYSCFAALGLEVTVEDSTSHGRLDMAVVFNEHVYLFEFKVVESQSDGGALTQLRSAATRTSTAHRGDRSTSSAWSSARRRAIWRPWRWPGVSRNGGGARPAGRSVRGSPRRRTPLPARLRAPAADRARG